MTSSLSTRRYDLDWLRTLAFMVLILYHIGMYYVSSWNWHIKSAETFTWLQNVMILTNTWRMSLLFFIAAMALSIAQQRFSLWQLARLRSSRLMIPLIFGMLVVVMPQAYIELLSQGKITPGVLAFWGEYVNPDNKTLTWNHLWFLPYLWVYSLIAIALASPLNRIAQSAWLQNVSGWGFLMVVIVAMFTVYWLLRLGYPTTHDFSSDWYNHGKYGLVFLFGYWFARLPNWWQWVIDNRRVLLVLGLLSYSLILVERTDVWDWLTPLRTGEGLSVAYGLVQCSNHWFWIFALVGYAGKYLNRPSPILSYSTDAILPWYMLLQTLIVVFAWWLKPYAMTPSLEFPVLLLMTVAGCLLGYELVRRNSLLRVLFGLKLNKPRVVKPENAASLSTSSVRN